MATTERRPGLVVFAKDKARVSAFYRQTLQLAVLEQEASHDLLQGDGIEIVVHSIPAAIAARIVIANPVRARKDTPLKPAFVVADLDAVRAAAVATGGHLKPRAGAWKIRGATVLDGWDPEGNVVQFKQFDP
jgi:predicted enzyme related to lactoylglutathione lyase